MQRSRSGAPRREKRCRFDQVEEGLLTPLHVVEDDHQGCLFFEQLLERPADLVAPLAASDSPSSERIVVAAPASEGSAASCLITSTTGQYVMPSP